MLATPPDPDSAASDEAEQVDRAGGLTSCASDSLLTRGNRRLAQSPAWASVYPAGDVNEMHLPGTWARRGLAGVLVLVALVFACCAGLRRDADGWSGRERPRLRPQASAVGLVEVTAILGQAQAWASSAAAAASGAAAPLAAAAPALAAAAPALAAAAPVLGSPAPQPQATLAPGEEFTGRCKQTDKDMDYLPNGPGQFDYSLDHIPEPGMCCAMCHGIPECKAWVWKNAHLQDCPYQCWILVTAPQAGAPAPGVISGLPPARPPLRLAQPEFVQQGLAAPGAIRSPIARKPAQSSGSQDASGRHCAAYGENCWSSRCCQNPAHKCFMKNAAWAGCKESCTPGVDYTDPPDAQQPWSCTDQTAAPAGGQQPPPPEDLPKTGPLAPTSLTPPPPEAPFVPQPPLAPEAKAPGTGTGPSIPGLTLFCFSLVQPDGYEPKMLQAQHQLGTAIFACEGFAVYSNRAFEVAEGVATSVVLSSLQCEFHEIAWNTGIFIAVWHKVINQGWYQHYDWTVKVDPDATFFANRLRGVLRDHTSAGYLGNCKYGLHGPIEVLSTAAVDALAQDYADSADGSRPHKCIHTFPQAITGTAQWGEDMFLDYCLSKVLGVSSEPDERLMCEAHCDCPDWYWCHNNTGRVTYHPFKRVDMYNQCIANAMYGAPDA